MILIKSIETIEVEGDLHNIYQNYGHQGHVPCYKNGAEPSSESIEVIQELVRSKHFVQADGQRVYIGQTKAVADVIGIQYEAWDSMEKRLEEVRSKLFNASCDLVKSNNELSVLKNLSFWAKLKGLFN